MAMKRQNVAVGLATAGLLIGGLALLRFECSKVESTKEFNAPNQNNGPANNIAPNRNQKAFARFELLKESPAQSSGSQKKA